MFKVLYRGEVIDTCISKTDVIIKYGSADDIFVEEFCDICETNKITNHESICGECHLGINVDLFA